MDTNRPKRRLVNIGPGLIVALIISAFIGARWIGSEKQMRAQKTGSPIVERQVVSSSFEGKAGPTPEVKFILDRSGKLGLGVNQVRKLTELQSEWQRIYGPKMAEANAEAAKTREYLANAKDNPRTPVAQIQNEAADVIALSAEISSARRSYWSRALNVLTADQRKALQSEREAAWDAKTKSLPH